jgi:hypothetical protein
VVYTAPTDHRIDQSLYPGVVYLLGMEQANQDEEISDLPEMLRLVKSDTKLIVKDLLEGVDLWAHTSFLVLAIGVLGLLLCILTLGRGVLAAPTGVFYYAEVLATFCLGVTGVSASLFYNRKYSKLRRKYQALFEAAKKL